MDFIEQAKHFIMKAISEEKPVIGQSIFWKRLTVSISQLPPPVSAALEDAMKELQTEGIFDENERITEKGIAIIQGTPSQRIDGAKKVILNQLRQIHARVGYTPNWRAFITMDQTSQDYLLKATNELQREGILDENGALTEKGYDLLYS